MQTYKVAFEYIDEGFILLEAENDDAAEKQAASILKELRSADIISITEIDNPQEEINAVQGKGETRYVN